MNQDWNNAMDSCETTQAQVSLFYGQEICYFIQEAYRIICAGMGRVDVEAFGGSAEVSADRIGNMVAQGILPRDIEVKDMTVHEVFMLCGVRGVQDAWAILGLS